MLKHCNLITRRHLKKERYLYILYNNMCMTCCQRCRFLPTKTNYNLFVRSRGSFIMIIEDAIVVTLLRQTSTTV